MLGTVAHFRPILSMTKPAGKIMAKTQSPEIEKSRPISFGVRPSSELA